MKKTYQTPATFTTVVELKEMITASPYGQPEKGFDMNSLEETGETSGNLSRGHHSAWDDEYEEEDL